MRQLYGFYPNWVYFCPYRNGLRGYFKIWVELPSITRGKGMNEISIFKGRWFNAKLLLEGAGEMAGICIAEIGGHHHDGMIAR